MALLDATLKLAKHLNTVTYNYINTYLAINMCNKNLYRKQQAMYPSSAAFGQHSFRTQVKS